MIAYEGGPDKRVLILILKITFFFHCLPFKLLFYDSHSWLIFPNISAIVHLDQSNRRKDQLLCTFVHQKSAQKRQAASFNKKILKKADYNDVDGHMVLEIYSGNKIIETLKMIQNKRETGGRTKYLID